MLDGMSFFFFIEVHKISLWNQTVKSEGQFRLFFFLRLETKLSLMPLRLDFSNKIWSVDINE